MPLPSYSSGISYLVNIVRRNNVVITALTTVAVLRRALLCIVAGAMMFSACTKSWTQEDERFVQAYTEILIVREQFANDSAQANKRVQGALSQYGFSEGVFRSRFNELSRNPEKLRQLLDSARNRARRIAEEEGKKELDRQNKGADSLKKNNQAPQQELR